eukprot:579708-Amphidinium_carterae.1
MEKGWECTDCNLRLQHGTLGSLRLQHVTLELRLQHVTLTSWVCEQTYLLLCLYFGFGLRVVGVLVGCIAVFAPRSVMHKWTMRSARNQGHAASFSSVAPSVPNAKTGPGSRSDLPVVQPTQRGSKRLGLEIAADTERLRAASAAY